MQARKLAAQVAELRALPDNKRCWDCEQLVSNGRITLLIAHASLLIATHMRHGASKRQ
jgi:hypothetical protein